LAFHTQWHGFFSVKNPYQMYYYSELIQNQWLANAPLLVDLFFVISGFLMCYNFLRNNEQMEGIKTDGLWKNFKLFGKMVLQRYLR
jgi:peptidoglycan/LPS O-acetylase OafA/YrhL